jgi:hypothetical protein
MLTVINLNVIMLSVVAPIENGVKSFMALVTGSIRHPAFWQEHYLK